MKMMRKKRLTIKMVKARKEKFQDMLSLSDVV